MVFFHYQRVSIKMKSQGTAADAAQSFAAGGEGLRCFLAEMKLQKMVGFKPQTPQTCGMWNWKVEIAGSPTLVGSEADLALPLGWFIWRTICRKPLYFMGKVIENPWFPVEFPLNQSVDWIYSGTRTRGNKHAVWQPFLDHRWTGQQPIFWSAQINLPSFNATGVRNCRLYQSNEGLVKSANPTHLA